MMRKKKRVVSLWGDHIVISSLFIGLIISLSLIALTFTIIEIIATHNATIAASKKDYLYGFGTLAVVIGFFINNLWIKPQRNIISHHENNENEGEQK